MKVLIFIHSLGNGGAERAAAGLADQWVREGLEVTLVTLAPADSDFYAIDARVRRVALGLNADSGNCVAAIWHNSRRIMALRGVLEQFRPSVALAMMNTACVLLAFASVGMPVATVGAERSQPSASPLGWAWSWARSWAYGRLRAVIALTPESAEWIRSHTGAKKVVVIPNPVIWPLPDQFPHIAPSCVGRAERRRLLAVGRLTHVKGMDTLLAAFAQLASHHPDWELVIVGDGPEYLTLRAVIDANGLSECALLAGRAGNLADWYRSADMFVLTSRHEGFPNALLEAMAHGLTCISFDCEAGPRNIIRNGVDGILVRDQDTVELVSVLDRLMRDASARAQYAERATEIRERFALAHVSSLWRTLFAEVCHERA